MVVEAVIMAQNRLLHQRHLPSFMRDEDDADPGPPIETARKLGLTPTTIRTKLQNWESEEEGAGN